MGISKNNRIDLPYLKGSLPGITCCLKGFIRYGKRYVQTSNCQKTK